MATISKSASYNAGKHDAQEGLPASPAGHAWPSKYMNGHRKWTERHEQAQAKKAQVKRDMNPVTHCATCLHPRREKAFEVYDVANDLFYCNTTCQDNQKETA